MVCKLYLNKAIKIVESFLELKKNMSLHMKCTWWVSSKISKNKFTCGYIEVKLYNNKYKEKGLIAIMEEKISDTEETIRRTANFLSCQTTMLFSKRWGKGIANLEFVSLVKLIQALGQNEDIF